MKIRIVQLGVQEEMAANQARITAALDTAQVDEWLVFPEGVLSGYFPDRADYPARLNAPAIERAVEDIQRLVLARKCNCLFGTALLHEGRWRNSVLLLTSDGTRHVHHKVELSELDRKVFAPGTQVTPYTVGNLTLGIQACRELIFPQTWSVLKAAGAQIIFHINNAIQPHDAQWEHILIARAIEQSIFVCSVNNGQAPQALASYLIAPSGRVLLKTERQQDQALSAEINPGEVIADLSRRADY
ncbi:MAG TPA: carbon-nitrogen hydrolase family protein [Blastocatellia bacterium]|nr:carbon-nitrogen hydrolase family protein [Blastocatellia bacterium]HMV84241.1 carbon-nitrogen hydrolase family protein [Blastocatellia bacterium]HMX26249.1 carbon-nitrogen hydrolase family protein [Blastocatellia bacterium]HMY76922.1 carbon-nitrogen hydrolase family protein [Blastocatellia bacterium]HMZ21131.1 carbon-nitrogen hydrolase family protein [Blastocatellia bacterium]